MRIRHIEEDDIVIFHKMMCRLDEETPFMMYEPGERQARTSSFDPLRKIILEAVSGVDLLLVAENDIDELVGFVWAERGKLNRIAHTAQVVAGIRKGYRHRGIGTEFFRQLEDWARSNGILRLELTVECANTNAFHLYEKVGFEVEGVRRKSMNVDGQLVDEYYMGKLLD